MKTTCHSCKKILEFTPGTVISRSETCDHCRAELRCCKQCFHYDTSSYNDCKESQAERIVEKTKGNFCNYYRLMTLTYENAPGKSKEDVLEKAKALFKNL